ncbi:MAG TPA: hypothetical protein VMS02_09575 [Solirubrobacteraceae bacterium]|nr:hypothetical protein [Solirubrobacteraceae bacterium]
MSTQEAQQGETGGTGAAGQPSEAELRAAYEAELSRITSADMVLQATVSLLNIGARRLGLLSGPGEGDGTAAQQTNPERDLEQVADAIDAVRGLMPVVERRAPQEARPLRDALSQLQMAYAREAQGAPVSTPPPAQPSSQTGPTPPQAAPAPPQPGAKPEPGPAESSGRLWVPGR